MRIMLDGRRVVDTIERLFQAVQVSEEKGTPSIYTATILDDGESWTGTQFEEIVRRFLETSEQVNIKIQFQNPVDSKWNAILEDLFRAKAQRLAESINAEKLKALEPQLEQKSSHAQPKPKRPSPKPGLQVQRQQQQQQQQQQSAPSKYKRRPVKSRQGIELEEKSIPSESLGTLINETNIKEKLGAFASQVLTKNDPDLLTIWNNLVGPGARDLEKPEDKITDVPIELMKDIIRNYREFSYGLVMHNLPQDLEIKAIHERVGDKYVYKRALVKRSQELVLYKLGEDPSPDWAKDHKRPCYVFNDKASSLFFIGEDSITELSGDVYKEELAGIFNQITYGSYTVATPQIAAKIQTLTGHTIPSKPSNPLRLSLEPRPRRSIEDSFNQLMISILQNRTSNQIIDLYKKEQNTQELIACRRQFDRLIQPDFPPDIKSQAFLFFINQLTQDTNLIQQISSYSIKPEMYKALLGLLIHEGVHGVLLFLKQLPSLPKECAPFLTEPDNCIFFISSEGQKQLKQLQAMNASQRTWWNVLVQHHQMHSEMDFKELFQAYSYFLGELKALGKSNLPPTCPIKGINHMKSALDRALYMLKEGLELQDLEGLDFSSTGAYLAMHNYDYTALSSSMELSVALSKGRVRRNVVDDKSREQRTDIMKALIEGWDKSLGDSIGIKKRQEIVDLIVKINPQYAQEVNLLIRTLFTSNPNLLSSIIQTLKSLTPGTVTYQPPTREEYFKGISDSPNRAIRDYYRYVGRYSSFPLEVYKELEKMANEGLYSEHKKTFTEKEVAYFLGVVAFITSGKESRCFDPIKEVADLLEAVKEIDSRYLKIVDESIICEFYFLSMIEEQNLPSLPQLTSLLKFINAFSVIGDGTNEFISFVRQIFTLIKSYQKELDSVLIIFENLKIKHTKNINGNPIINKTLFIRDSYYILLMFSDRSIISQKLPEHIRASFVLLMSLTSDPVTDFSDENIIVLTCENLIKSLKNLNEPLCKELLTILNTIDIRQSQQLPSRQTLAEFFEKIKREDETNLLAELDPEKRKNQLIQLVLKQFSRTTFALETPKEDPNEALVTALRLSYREFNPTRNLNDLLEDNGIFHQVLKGTLPMGGDTVFQHFKNNEQIKILKQALEGYEAALFRQPMDMQNLLSAQEALDKACSAIIDNIPWGIKSILEAILNRIYPEENDSRVQKALRFIESKKILALLDDLLREKSLETLHNKLTLLQLGGANQNLSNYFSEKLPQFDLNISTKDAFDAYNGAFISLNECINCMISIKNRESRAAYQDFISAVNENCSHISLTDFNAILKTLEKHTALPASRQWHIVSQVVRQNPEKITNLHYALTQLGVLTNLKGLPPELYATLYELSFRHTLTNATPFPIEALVKLKLIPNINEQEAERLSQSVLDLLGKPGVSPGVVSSLITQITGIIETRIERHPEIVPAISSLLKLCEKNEENAEDLTTLNTMLGQLSKYGGEDLNHLLHIIQRVPRKTPLGDLGEMFRQMEIRHPSLHDLKERLFTYAPYPNISILNAKLAEDKEAFDNYCIQYDKDPGGRRWGYVNEKEEKVSREEILEQQFSSKRIQDVVLGIREILADSPLNSEQQYDIALQLVFINTLGQKAGITLGDETNCPALTEATREDLGRYSKNLIAKLQEEAKAGNTQALKQTHLELITVLREVYYRSTGKFPRTTQLLALLMPQEYQGDLLLQISTGEGKSIISALLATLAWAKGGCTVDVCTANRSLADQDYSTKANVNFFDFLGIPSSLNGDDYQVGGINYSTIEDLALLYADAKLEGRNLKEHKGKVFRNDLILEEGDSTSLDNRKLLNLAKGNATTNSSLTNPYEFIYPLVNDYIDSHPEELCDWTDEKAVEALRTFLYNKCQPLQIALLAEKDYPQYQKWLKSAVSAKDQKIGSAFLLSPVPNKPSYWAAIPVDSEGNPVFGVTFQDGVHQFLHARLAKTFQDRSFEIDPELSVVDSQSPHSFISENYSDGRIISVTGSAGSRDELVEQASKYGLRAFEIPTHETKRLIELGTTITPSAKFFTEIFKVLNKRPNQADPVLMLCRDSNHATEIMKALNGRKQRGLNYQSINAEDTGQNLATKIKNAKAPNCITIQIITGAESKEDLEAKIALAGQANVITISPFTKRGTDITPQISEHVGQALSLWVLDLHLEITERGTKQGKGRTARDGRIGYYAAIYDNNGLTHSHGESLSSLNAVKCKAAIKRMQKAMTEEAAVERHYIQEVAGIQRVLIQELDNWQAFCRTEGVGIEKTIDSSRERLIGELSEAWVKALEDSDPEKRYSDNPYVRRAANGKLDVSALNAALKQFEDKAIGLWNDDIKKSLKKQAGETLNKRLETSPGDTLGLERLEYMDGVSIPEQIKLQKLNIRQLKKAALHEQQEEAFTVEQALDPNTAVLRYGRLTEDEHAYAQEESNKYQLQLYIDAFNEILDKMPIKAREKSPLKIGISKNSSAEDKARSMKAKFKSFTDKFKQDVGKMIQMRSIWMRFDRLGLSNLGDPDVSYVRKAFNSALITQINRDLRAGFSWTTKDIFKIERSALKKAAIEINKANDELKKPNEELKKPNEELKNANNEASESQKIQNLYQTLYKHAKALDGLWFIRHKKSRDLILSMIKNLSNLMTQEQQLRNQAQAIKEFYLDQIDSWINTATKGSRWQQFFDGKKGLEARESTWRPLCTAIAEIKQNNKTPYALYEIRYQVEKHLRQEGLNKTFKSQLQELLTKINAQIDNFDQELPKMYPMDVFLNTMAERFKTKLKKEIGEEFKEVTLEEKNSGINTYYELQLDNPPSKPLFNDFVKYNSRVKDIEERLAKAENELKPFKDINELMKPIVTSQEPRKITIPNALPNALKSNIETCNAIYDLLEAKDIGSIQVEDAELSGLVASYKKIKEMSFDGLASEVKLDTSEACFLSIIEEKKRLKQQIDLLKKEIGMKQPFQKQSIIDGWFKTVGAMVGLQKTPEQRLTSVEKELNALPDTFEKTKNEKLNALKKQIKTKLSTQWHDILKKADRENNSAINRVQCRIDFFKEEKEKESAKTTKATKSFSTLNELFDWEAQVNTMKKNPELVGVAPQ